MQIRHCTPLSEEKGVHLHPCTPPGYGPDLHVLLISFITIGVFTSMFITFYPFFSIIPFPYFFFFFNKFLKKYFHLSSFYIFLKIVMEGFFSKTLFSQLFSHFLATLTFSPTLLPPYFPLKLWSPGLSDDISWGINLLYVSPVRGKARNVLN